MNCIAICLYLCIEIVTAVPSFEVNFKSPVTWSSKNWMIFKGSIPTLKEFTNCHWENKEFTSTKTSPIWEFCWQTSPKKIDLSCITIFSAGLPITKTKISEYSLSISNLVGVTLQRTIQVKNTYHRIWNHICYTYSSITNTISLYYNGEMVYDGKERLLPIIPGTSEMSEYVFLIGQRMDGLRTGYTASHTFFGKIIEVNMWNKILTTCEIREMSQLDHFPKGNVVAWKIDNFQVKGLQITNVRKLEDHLQNEKQYLIYPKRQLRSIAMRTCSSHGGVIVTPESKEETSRVLKVLAQHKKICLDEFTVTKDPDMGVWLGPEKYDDQWTHFSEESKLLYLNYSNWKDLKWKGTSKCAIMNKDGSWGAHDYTKCVTNQLCTICSFKKPPIFKLKGLCNQGSFQWFYYPVINETNQIDRYEGYLGSQEIAVKDDSWLGKNGDDRIQIFKVKDIVGRNKWSWYEGSCTNKASLRNLTFSNCDVDNQFTCDFGDCISINKRCDTIQDCNDGSDEEKCMLVDIPSSYNKLEAPPKNGESQTSISFGVIIENINRIDTINLVLETTMKLNMTWKDSRLKFRNLPFGREKMVKPEIARDLWTPLNDFVFPNAIIGSLQEDSVFELFVRTNSSPLPFLEAFVNAHEDSIYAGEDTTLRLTRRIRLQTTCSFEFIKFPFDKHICEFIFGAKETDQGRIYIKENENSFEYVGEKIVGQFNINQTIPRNDSLDSNQLPLNHGLRFAIELQRSPQGGIQMIIIPTLIIWLVAFLTLFLDVDDLNNRSQIAVNLLLILVTFFGSISVKDDYPETTSFKYIDAWFLWYFANLLIIIYYHVVINNLYLSISRCCIVPKDAMYGGKPNENRKRRINFINRLMTIFLFFGTVSFNVIYIIVGTNFNDFGILNFIMG